MSLHPPPFRVLVVEDNDDHADLLLRAIRKAVEALQITRVVDGEGALAFLRRQAPYADATRPDLVLLDLKLPGLSGHDVLGEIKKDPRLSGIPVVVLTTSDSTTDRSRAYQHHVNSYLVKPVDSSMYRRLVHDLSAYWVRWNRSIDTAT